MSKLLFSLRGVPDDEAMEIRALLSEKEIDYYETSAGNWGISMPALWVVNNQDLEAAQQLLESYHQYRAVSQRKIYQQLKKQGKHRRFIDVLKEKPLQIILYIATAGLIIYIYFKMLHQFGL